MENAVPNSDYKRIEKAILFLEENANAQPSLNDVAEHIGLSPHHFQRLFKRWAGVSPKRFCQYLTTEHAKELLRDSASVLETAHTVGLSGPGRLHDLFVSVEAVTPGQFKQRSEGVTIRYGVSPSPFGFCLVALTEKGICELRFLDENRTRPTVGYLKGYWSGSEFIEDQKIAAGIVDDIFSKNQEKEKLRIHLSGTNFQIKVWKALLDIPAGAAVSYSDLARHIDLPGGARAVGNAVGKNPVGYLIPCHRVIKSSGATGGFGSGPIRKKAMLGWEFSRAGNSR